MKIIMYLFLGLAMFFALDCDNTNDTEVEDKEFLNTIWTLTSFEIDGEVIAPPEDQVYTIQFKKDSTVSGKNDCNDFFANYLIASDDLLRLEQLVTTKIGCGGDQSFSDKYIQGLSAAKSYSILKNYLYIYYGDNSRLIFYGK
ncbi:MAG TPA: META domain-containing protein [Candidatus Marinimicrobia bacterium]|jgi:heat shock protein HslJ|nr:META domain-containing protein [Candidatus Neomarinimicrobiota bacterium]